MAGYHLAQLVPKDIVTRLPDLAMTGHRPSTIDLVFTNLAAFRCEVGDDHFDSDHFPIRTSIPFPEAIPLAPAIEMRDWKTIDRAKLQAKLDLTPPIADCHTTEQLNIYVATFVQHMDQAVDAAVGTKTICPGRSRKGWTPQLTDLRREMRTLERRMSNNPDIREAELPFHTEARRQYCKSLKA